MSNWVDRASDKGRKIIRGRADEQWTAAPKVAHPSRPAPADKVLKILIIDEDAGARQTLQQKFYLEGIQATTAGTGGEGLELTKSVDFDWILIDLFLTDMSGLDLLSDLCNSCSGRLVVMSAWLTVHTAVDAMKRGAFDVVGKPLDFDRVLSMTRRCSQDPDARFPVASRKGPPYDRVTIAPRSVVERWVGYVIKVYDATSEDTTGDLKTLGDWARRVGVSYSTLCETCCLLGIRPLDARDFARVLRAVRAAIDLHCAPEILLNVSNRRVLRGLSSKSGVELEAPPDGSSLDAFLNNQRFIPQSSEALRLVRVLAWDRLSRGGTGK